MLTVTNILLVDDHSMLREGLRQIIETEPGLHVCGMAANVREALELVESAHPDLVITDLTMPAGNGLELVRNLGATHPRLPVIVLSLHNEILYAERALRAGARGYVPKSAPTALLIEAIRCVMEGGLFARPPETRRLREQPLRPHQSLQSRPPPRAQAHAEFPLRSLTDREMEIFELIGHAMGTQEIAAQLGINPRTVDLHRARIREKLDLGDNHALNRHAIRWVRVGMLGG